MHEAEASHAGSVLIIIERSTMFYTLPVQQARGTSYCIVFSSTHVDLIDTALGQTHLIQHMLRGAAPQLKLSRTHCLK